MTNPKSKAAALCMGGKQPAQTGKAFMVILGVLMAFTSLSTDIYLPAMPVMADELHGNAELTVTGFLVGFAIAQLVWGPVSDRIGRRKPLFIGMVLFVIGSIGCAMSQTMEQVVFWRVFQALGACTGPMLARAMIRDLYSRTEAAKMLSTLMVIMAVAPIIGPLLGGQLLKIGSWHSIFWLLAVIGALMFAMVFRLPETLPDTGHNSVSIWHAFANYRMLLANGPFMRYTLSLTFYYTAVYAFIVASPFVYINYFGIDAQHYGLLFGLNILGVMGLSMINRYLVMRFSLDALLRTATGVAALAALLPAVAVKADMGGIVGIVVPVFVAFTMNGVIAASATAAALDSVPKMVGSASALIGALQYGSGIVSSIMLAVFSDGTPWPMAWMMALFMVLGAVMAFSGSRSKV